jgi:hypothetical protein
MSAHLVKNILAVHGVEDDLESSLYVVLWTALMYRESYMTIVDRTQFIVQIFDADPLVGSGGSAKSNWLVARTDFPQDIFVNCKQLDILVLELAQFFSHRYSVLPLEAHEKLVKSQLSLKEILEEVGPVRTAAQQKIIDVAKSLLLESPAYQKEMGMRVLHSHKAVIDIYNKHLGSSNWPDNDAAVWQKTHPLEKPSGRRLYTKSVCPSQDMTPVWVQITPSGKKRRLAPEDDVVASLDDGLDDLVSFGS